MDEWKILLIDDDEEDRSVVEEALQTVEPGVTIRFAQNGHEGLKLLSEQFELGSMPCLIILDVNMPKLNGPETLMKLKADHRFQEIPVVIYSTSVNPFEKDRCISIGAQAYFTKPVTYKDSIAIAKIFLELCELRKLTDSHQK